MISDSTPAHLSLTAVSKQFRARGRDIVAVDAVDLDVAPQTCLGIVGESGSGKSTLARLITGLETPSAGSITMDGQLLEERRRSEGLAFRHRSQMVFQNPFDAVNPRLTVRQIVAEPLKRLRLGAEQAQERLHEALTVVDLMPVERYLERRPFELSGGQLQRVVMARALIPRPGVLIGDEPVSMLDVSARARILNLFRRLKRDITCVLISHDLALIGYVCDQVAVMYRGRIVEQGPTRAILARPHHPYTAALIAATPQPTPDQPRTPLPIVTDDTTGGGAEDRVDSCGFAPRCPQARDRCRQVRPLLHDLPEDGTRRLACHYPIG